MEHGKCQGKRISVVTVIVNKLETLGLASYNMFA